MRKLTAIVILLALALVLAGCETAPNGKEKEITSNTQKEEAEHSGEVDEVVLPKAVQMIFDGLLGTEYEVTDFSLAPETDQRFENNIVNTYVLELKNADNIYVFEFGSKEAAAQHAGYYNEDGSQYNSPNISMCIDYIAPVRMWRCEECVIEYANQDDNMYLPICKIFGAPFVGKTSVVEKIETFDIQYVRTDGEELNNVIVIIDSYDELMNYYNENKDRFYLERQETVYSDTTIGFLDACDVYTPEWFETHQLALVIFTEGSGSIRHKITSVTIRNYDLESFNKEDYTLQINVQRFSPEVQTCDMATWHIMIGLPKREYPEITAVGINELWDTDFLWTGDSGSVNDYDEIRSIEYSCDLSKFPSSIDINEYGEVLKVYENGLLVRSGSEKAKEEYGDLVFLVCDDAWAYDVGQVVTYVFRDVELPAQEGDPLNIIALLVYME